MLDELIRGMGIIKCINNAKEVYYLDIEKHKLYTEAQLIKILERGNKVE